MDLVAEEGGEDDLLATGLYPGARAGQQAFEECGVPMAAISQLGPPSRRCDREIGEAMPQGLLAEVPGIPAAATTGSPAG